MKNNPLPPDPKEELLGELATEILLNLFAASVLQGLLAAGSNMGDPLSDQAFQQAHSMMRRSRLPAMIEKLQKLK